MQRAPLLLVGYESPDLAAHVRALEAHTSVVHARDEVDVDRYLRFGHHADVILWRMGAIPAEDLDALGRVGARYPGATRVTHGNLLEGELAQAIARGGVYLHVPDTAQPGELALIVSRALDSHDLARRHRQLAHRHKLAEVAVAAAAAASDQRTDLAPPPGVERFGGLVFRGQGLARIAAMAKKAAKTDLPVLIQGEVGTGKELLARAIHAHSARAARPMLAQRCGAVPDEVLRGELFGQRRDRSAAGGALAERMGLFAAADGGTVLLDQVSELSPSLQATLLRVLQHGAVQLEGDDQVACDVRLVTSCHRGLKGLSESGRFRTDLYFRLNAFELVLPPLRDRLEDIPALVEHFARAEGSQAYGGISRELVERMQSYDWPGNVRELQNEVRRMVSLSERGEELTSAHLSPALQSIPIRKSAHTTTVFVPRGLTLKEKVESLETHVVREALTRNHWNQSKTAAELGLSRPGLASKIARYNLGHDGAGARDDGP